MYVLLFIILLIGLIFCLGAWKARKNAPLHALFLGLLGSSGVIVSGYLLFYLVLHPS